MDEILLAHDAMVPPTDTGVGRTELALLHAEQVELEEAVVLEERHLVLDEVVDVIYRARQVAAAFGITAGMLERYAEYKGALRAVHRKDKELEHYIAFGITHQPLKA